MLIPNHPHDERLSALASGDPEAVADSVLSEHVASCHRCTDTVAELGALRASLAELPDLRPHRPLQLLPPVTDAPPSRVDRAGGWARRFFAPVLTAGAALAMVGLVGTTAPILAPMAQSGPEMLDSDATNERALTAPEDGAGGAATTEEPTTMANEFNPTGGDSGEAQEPLPTDVQAQTREDDGDSGGQPFALSEDRPIWPMVLFAGIAIMIAAALMRWILAPRSG